MRKIRFNMLVGAGHLCVESPEITRQKMLVMHCHFHHFQVALHADLSETLVQHDCIIGENVQLRSVNERFGCILNQIRRGKQGRNAFKLLN